MDKEYIFGIASYDRADRQPMLHYLNNFGYGRDRIIISTQTEKDYIEYKRRYNDIANVIFKPANNISQNKNTILEYADKEYNGKPIIMCSDKVRAITYMDGKELKEVQDAVFFDKLCRKAIEIATKLKAPIFGLYSVGNTFYMEHSISTNRNILGCFMGILDNSLRFDERIRLKEDFQICCECLKNGRRWIRFNDLAIKATFHTKGGCHKDWFSKGDEINRTATNIILDLYPSFTKRHPKKQNEVRLTTASKKFKVSIIDLIK